VHELGDQFRLIWRGEIVYSIVYQSLSAYEVSALFFKIPDDAFIEGILKKRPSEAP
jgi:hypothetical protein